ncbi:polysaccharide lyase family 8 super-sandwich domain-containing protein [Streptomyces sp. FIT100]|uniref:polysaccharide lyase family 8 super-sandwich domain-containing protein n=1 Tax=Streptomyces sp. FIT100 TaxID=2837956 RepID=UPI0021C82404|nr:polysaccharide lyase family 8 super-sandwich domain-containing protein [Streptomyces sp. FIT100]UUN25667.1 polysaccharide lyase 8 family protein [Streptomyces sp. FIT100]
MPPSHSPAPTPRDASLTSSALSRRRFLAVTGGSVALAAVLPHLPAAAAGDAYDTLRTRWADIVTGGDVDPADPVFAPGLQALNDSAAAHYNSLDRSTGRTALWSDLPIGSSHPSANITSTAKRLKTIAVAYATPGGVYIGNAGVAADVAAGLQWLTDSIYNTGQSNKGFGNSYDWVIGAPQAWGDAACLVHSSMTSAQFAAFGSAIDHFIPDVSAKNMPSGFGNIGANRTDICQAVIVCGILNKTSARISTAVSALSAVFPTVRSSDGFYADGSYIQHGWVPYTGSYGAVLLGGLSRLFSLLAGSGWAVTDPARQNILDAVQRSYAPFVYNGLLMYGVCGRGNSRGLMAGDTSGVQYDEHTSGHVLTAHILRLAEGASATEATAWRRMAKGWTDRAYWSPYQQDKALPLSYMALVHKLLTDQTVTGTPEPVEHRVFGSMDRAVHRRPDWAFTVSMCSARTTFYESGNGENLRGWHTSNGMTYWWRSTSGNGQYDDAFWPTVDPYRLPGATNSRKALADAAGGPWGQTRPTAVWAGGVTDGTYAALGQHVQGLESTLQGRKSWFCLDDSVVCLGADIRASDGTGVDTTVDNRNLGATGPHKFTVDGTVKPTTTGYEETLTGIRWAHIDGMGGYVFPGGATVRAKREARTGAWRDIHVGSSTTALTRVYLTMWYDHGTDPTAGTYAYQLLPGADTTTTAQRAQNPTFTVLANTANVQAITDTATGVTAANFLAAGTAGPITVSAPCSVLMRESGGTLSVSVADPTRAATTITVTLNRTGYTTASGDEEVSILGLSPVKLLVETGGSEGGPRRITLGTGPSVTAGQTVTLSPTSDAHTRDGSYATTNYGAGTLLDIKTDATGYNRRAYLKFDLASLPAAPRRAVLWLHGETADSTGTQGTLGAYATTGADSWTEPGLTWNNQPALGALQSTAPLCENKDWIPLDVTALVTAAHHGDGIATVALAQATKGLAVQVHSRQNAEHRPFLQVITD